MQRKYPYRRILLIISRSFLLLGISWSVLSCKPSSINKPKKPPNVLFISIDDLRPELGAYGYQHIHSPNLDRLTTQSLRFNRVYAQEPTCAPSRASLLSGLRPNASKVFDLYTPLRSVQPDILTLPQHFREHDYTTLSLGKIFHHPDEDDSLGWSKPAWKARLANLRGYMKMENIARITDWGNSSYYEIMDVPDEAYEDGKTAKKAVETLRGLAEKERPFFLAVGFFKPHLPFIAPKKYWDLYDSADFQLPIPYQMPNDRLFTNFTFGGEIASYLDATRAPRHWNYTNPEGVHSDSIWIMDEPTGQRLIHGYYASLSYADAQVGKVLSELERLDLRENTIIVVWSDHGWLLGELGDWSKQSLFELQTKATLIISPPNYQGAETNAITELLDVYPTLCELTGLRTPNHVQGKSLANLLNEPSQSGKDAAFTQHLRDYYNENGLVGKKYFQGYTVRTDRYRCTEWRLASNLDSLVGREFYDYELAPIELQNVADSPQYQQQLEEHAQLIAEHFLTDEIEKQYVKR